MRQRWTKTAPPIQSWQTGVGRQNKQSRGCLCVHASMCVLTFMIHNTIFDWNITVQQSSVFWLHNQKCSCTAAPKCRDITLNRLELRKPLSTVLIKIIKLVKMSFHKFQLQFMCAGLCLSLKLKRMVCVCGFFFSVSKWWWIQCCPVSHCVE